MKFFLISFLIVCCVGHQVDSAPPSYAVIQMVMLWPPTYCKSGNPCKEWSKIRKNFGLHGLWPADDKGISVIDCRGPNIPTYSTPEALKAYLSRTPKLVTDLSTYWPSIIQSERSGYPFWQGQWNKHGVLWTMTCSVFAAAVVFTMEKLEYGKGIHRDSEESPCKYEALLGIIKANCSVIFLFMTWIESLTFSSLLK
ncbi:hypothetical protein Acr_26g0007000 [Actinidia rufa]|uniref:Uncharacterized protein n=1 Tax=Actinidia rufa TaxID=165716 RepID=A0A7J0H2X1_9ERIC|nr:hypothetical protein Acr_26g0007000 [Actinidia rufa]